MKPSSARGIAAGLLCSITIAACRSAMPSRSPARGAAPSPAAPNARPLHTPADVQFMSNMIAHHAQAVLMAGWAASHGASPAVRALSERITVSQNDEIELMQRWLAERGEPVPPADPRGHTMPGMQHSTLVPGMLTPEQLAQLDRARGAEFDRLFLTFMIHHHQGAVTMVDRLLGSQGAAQDGVVFRFAADVHADQTAEIDRMRRMLAALTPGGKSP